MIFIDTGAFVARYIVRDQFHQKSLRFWKQLAADREPCMTSNFVLDETFTILARVAGHRFAAGRARTIYASDILTILRPSEEDEMKALDYFEKYGDQGVSFTDCISFVLMKQKRARRIFSFDKHFERAGFTILP